VNVGGGESLGQPNVQNVRAVASAHNQAVGSMSRAFRAKHGKPTSGSCSPHGGSEFAQGGFADAPAKHVQGRHDRGRFLISFTNPFGCGLIPEFVLFSDFVSWACPMRESRVMAASETTRRYMAIGRFS